MEAVLPIELEIPSLRVLMESQIKEVDWINARYTELALLDETRLKASYHHQGYQKRVARAFNKRIRSRGIVVGDLVLKEIREPARDPRGKFAPKWTGPYIVVKILSGGVVHLTDIDGQELHAPVNLDRLKKYYQ